MVLVRWWCLVARMSRVSGRWVLLVLFKQKTAYEMRISDWSSDVCSSDLLGAGRFYRVAGAGGGRSAGGIRHPHGQRLHERARGMRREPIVSAVDRRNPVVHRGRYRNGVHPVDDRRVTCRL